MDALGDALAFDAPGYGPATGRSRPKVRAFPPSLLMIGASTGGPQALVDVLSAIGPALPFIAVAVTLHMPADLVPVIAAHVTRRCGVPTHIVTESGPMERSLFHFAPGNRHIAIRRVGNAFFIAPTTGTSHRDPCKPAIDTMFASGAASHGSRALAVVLSGMGTDGLAGARAVVAAGGQVLVQDKLTSAVWGMPGAVAKAGLATRVLPPSGLAREIVEMVRGGAPRP